MRSLVISASFVACVFGVVLASSRPAVAGSAPSGAPEKASAGMRGDQPDGARSVSHASPSTGKKGSGKSETAKPAATKPPADKSTNAKPKGGAGGAASSGQVAAPSRYTAVSGGGSGGNKPKASAGTAGAGTPKQSSTQADTGPGRIDRKSVV